ncbi:MAG: type II toxin-antitoxin system prevent-host-death family antitoxin [Mycobacteriaceae bacterium]|nr:type II toxin-antitoxin system prevent-host-death family antitoxin [Mycobacteriaceae bacterium]
MKRRAAKPSRIAVPRWSELARRVAKTGERVVVQRAGESVAIVPVSDLRAIEAMEDQLDAQAVTDIRASAKPGDFVPLSALRTRRGRR